jgi:hypothetical protein
MSPVSNGAWPARRTYRTRPRAFSLPYRPTAVAEPPATRVELAYRCLQRPAPGMQVRTVPESGTDYLAMDGTAGCPAVI